MGPLTYALPEDVRAAPGTLVAVHVGRRAMTGVVLSETDKDPGREVRPVDAVLEDFAPLNAEWMGLVDFAARYYQHSVGEVAMRNLPPFLRKAPGPRFAAALKAYRKPHKRQDFPAWEPPELNAGQVRAVQAIDGAAGPKVFMLHGVTGSGKTEVYLRAIEALFAKNPGAQILMLVPEINLTPQLLARVSGRFPGRAVFAMHSGLSDGERMRSFLAMHEKRGDILIATRMGVFASLPELALIVVDEEHDLSYKADDGIRFNARDLAVARAHRRGCPVVLGSATPSLETWKQVREGRYELLALPEKALEPASPADIVLVDPRNAPCEKGLAQPVLEVIGSALAKGEQVLLFINRRGYAPILSCPVCGWVSTCAHCSSHTVYHKRSSRMICHHCGFSQAVPARCPTCGNLDLQVLGAGTQRLEESLEALWPQARVLRIDADVTRTKGAAQSAFERVHAGEVDIVVGTQMIAKGHDFKRVSTVVILNVDAQIAAASGKSEERAFINMMQVSGRAGRAGLHAKIYIQTRFGDRPLFEALRAQDYAAFADAALAERREALAAPYVCQALLAAQAPHLHQAMAFLEDARARGLALPCREELGIAVYDVVPMNLVRLSDKERAQLLFEGPNRRALNAFLSELKAWLVAAKSSVAWHIDVDPIDV